MFRFCGALLIVLGCGALGAVNAGGLSRHCRALSSFSALFTVLMSEICDRRTPMAEIMSRLSGMALGDASDFCAVVLQEMRSTDCDFADAWCRAAERTALTRDEKDTLRRLGMSLGVYSTDEQRFAILAAKREFDRFSELAQAEKATQMRTKIVSGAAAGVFLAIILL